MEQYREMLETKILYLEKRDLEMDELMQSILLMKTKTKRQKREKVRE